jgi:hypothetical protein
MTSLIFLRRWCHKWGQSAGSYHKTLKVRVQQAKVTCCRTQFRTIQQLLHGEKDKWKMESAGKRDFQHNRRVSGYCYIYIHKHTTDTETGPANCPMYCILHYSLSQVLGKSQTSSPNSLASHGRHPRHGQHRFFFHQRP